MIIFLIERKPLKTIMSWELGEYLKVLTSRLNRPWLAMITEPAAAPPIKAWPGFGPLTTSSAGTKTREARGIRPIDSLQQGFIYFSLTHPPPTIKLFIFLLFLMVFPFGSKRAFILQDIHLTNMHC